MPDDERAKKFLLWVALSLGSNPEGMRPVAMKLRLRRDEPAGGLVLGIGVLRYAGLAAGN